VESGSGGGADAERGRYRRGIAPQQGTVADVVMHQRRLVEHFHRAGEVDGVAQPHGGGRGQQAGTGQHQAGSNPFAGGREDVPVDGVESATGDEDFVHPIGNQGQLIGRSRQRGPVNGDAVGCR